MNPINAITRTYCNRTNVKKTGQIQSKINFLIGKLSKSTFDSSKVIERGVKLYGMWTLLTTTGGTIAGASIVGYSEIKSAIDEKEYEMIPFNAGFGLALGGIGGAFQGFLAGIGTPFLILSSPVICYSLLNEK